MGILQVLCLESQLVCLPVSPTAECQISHFLREFLAHKTVFRVVLSNRKKSFLLRQSYHMALGALDFAQ